MSSGALRIVSMDELELTDWTVRDFIRFYVTIGGGTRGHLVRSAVGEEAETDANP